MLKTLRFVWAFGVVCGLTLVAFAQEIKVAAADPRGPKLTIEAMTHDFGTVVSGTPLTYTFKIKNEGTADLLIKNVAPS